MVLHRSAHYAVLRTWRNLAVAGVYAAIVVLATAVLIATLEERDPNRLRTDGNGKPVTMIEATIQAASERALVSPKTAAVVAGERTNDF
jgi:hypothetical protein